MGQIGVKITELAVTVPGVVPQAQLLQVGQGDEGCPGDRDQVIICEVNTLNFDTKDCKTILVDTAEGVMGYIQTPQFW